MCPYRVRSVSGLFAGVVVVYSDVSGFVGSPDVYLQGVD
jgi:hypothetical protein